jgi:hypothetical protein
LGAILALPDEAINNDHERSFIMSNATLQPSQLILARLRESSANSEQFSSDELRKIYLDHVCFGGGFLHYSILAAAIGSTMAVGEFGHLSSGGIVAAFFIVLFVAAGIGHAVMACWFNLMSRETVFVKVQAWALSQAPGESGARLARGASRLVTPLLIVGVLVAAAMTLPDRSKHEAELRQAVTASIHSMPEKSGGDLLGKASAWILNAAFKDDSSVSYIDVLGFQYHKLGVFSIVTNKKGEVVSIGAFNQVYVRDLSQTSTLK